jgi:hypothetical protein
VKFTLNQWIGVKENLQETIYFPIKIMGLSGVNIPKNTNLLTQEIVLQENLGKPYWLVVSNI